METFLIWSGVGQAIRAVPAPGLIRLCSSDWVSFFAMLYWEHSTKGEYVDANTMPPTLIQAHFMNGLRVSHYCQTVKTRVIDFRLYSDV